MGVSSIKDTPQASHRSRDHVSLTEFPTRRVLHDASGFDPEHAREFHTGRMSLPGEHLRAINPECFYPNQNLARPWHWD
jgi:hypothetical protein